MGSAIASAIISISIGVVIVTGGNKVINREPATVSTEVTSSMQGMVNGYQDEMDEHDGEVYVDGYGWIRLEYSEPYIIQEDHLTRGNGSIRCFGHRETWYSTNEVAGQATAVDIPGKHVADDGTIRDKDGFICVASSDLPFYSLVMTSVGPGKVYDCGCSHGTIDVYTNW
jgi:hypothetical protein